MKNSQQFFGEIVKNLSLIGVDSPEAEARMIFEKIFENDFKILVLESFPISFEIEKKVSEILSRRREHEPIQYILGVAPFYNFELFVDKNVLIPRPETEILVEYLIKNVPRNGKMLDIGCGSGTIGVTLAYERQDLSVTCVDISCEALAVAKKNAEKYNLKNITFRQSNLFSAILEKFDFIAANLPYIPENEYLECAEEVRRFEPKLALTADNGGLDLIFQTAQQCGDFLNKNGQIIFENGYNQAEKIVEFLQKTDNFQQISTIKDYNNYQRFTLAICK